MMMRVVLCSCSLLLSMMPKLWAETVELSRETTIQRPMAEVAEILLAFDKTCESGCFYHEPKLKEARILEAGSDNLVVWTNYAQVVPNQTYKIVDIDRALNDRLVITLSNPAPDQLKSLQDKYSLPHKTSLSTENHTWTLSNEDRNGHPQTHVRVHSKFSGDLLKGFAIQILKNNYQEGMSAKMNLLATGVTSNTRAEPSPPTRERASHEGRSSPVSPFLATDPSRDTALTYYQDIKPIIDAYCVTCHSSGGHAPFNLDTFDSVQARATWIAYVTEKKIMPPWGANAIQGHELKYDYSLSDDQIRLIRDWVKTGRQEGDPSQPGKPIDVAKPQLSHTDLTYSMREAWTTHAGEQDEYRCFPVTVNEKEPFYVTGYRLEHDNPAYIHHAFVFSFDPELAPYVQAMENSDQAYGYPCLVSPTTEEFVGLQPHTIAVSGLQGHEFAFAEGQGILVKPGTSLIFQIHYSKKLHETRHGSPAKDISRTTIHFRTQKTVSHPVESAYLMDLKWMETGGMILPAGQKDISYSYAETATEMPSLLATKGGLDISNGFYINAVFPHQHLLARGMRIWVESHDGTRRELIFDNFDRYNFHFQSTFQYEAPVFVSKSDKLRITCYWDNSKENQPEINGQIHEPIDVTWGEETNDEMCVATLLMSEP